MGNSDVSRNSDVWYVTALEGLHVTGNYSDKSMTHTCSRHAAGDLHSVGSFLLIKKTCLRRVLKFKNVYETTVGGTFLRFKNVCE